jgi:hypothetical protein
MHQTMEEKWKYGRIIYWTCKIINETCDTDSVIESDTTARKLVCSDVFTESYNLYVRVILHACETAVSNGPVYISRISNIYGTSVSF